jgi:hypothetical protein
VATLAVRSDLSRIEMQVHHINRGLYNDSVNKGRVLYGRLAFRSGGGRTESIKLSPWATGQEKSYNVAGETSRGARTSSP